MSEKPVVVVTGIAGNLGSRLLPLLGDFSVIGVDLGPPQNDSRLQFERLDLGEESSTRVLYELLRDVRPVSVIHLAFVIDPVRTQAEEHQVSGQQLREWYRLRGALLGRRGARDAEAHALVRIERKPAAVKAAKIRTAERVGRADERRGRARNGRTGCGLRRCMACRMRAAGAHEQQQPE